MSPSSLDLIISGSVLTFTPDLPQTLEKLPGDWAVVAPNKEGAKGLGAAEKDFLFDWINS